MNIIDFKENFIKLAKEVNITITDDNAEKFYNYMNLLIEWNKKINLTAIEEPKEIIIKHFIDSLIIEKYLKDGNSLIDIGTGAGFPGIPLKIQKNNLEVTLLDALNKRVNFLNEAIELLGLNNIEAIHGRAEDYGRNVKYRQMYDVCVSRAVAKLNVLTEYMLPLVKVGGQCLCMKGPNISEEIEDAEKAIELMGGKIKQIDKINLPGNNDERNIIIISKTRSTQNRFPRSLGKINKEKIK